MRPSRQKTVDSGRSSGIDFNIFKILKSADYSDKTRSRRHRPDYQILLFMSILMLIGLVVMFAIGAQRANVLNNAYGSDYGETFFFVKQAVSVMVAVAAFAGAAMIPYIFVTKHASKWMILALGLCILLAFADIAGLGIAQKSLGATRWFDLGPLSFQPAELLKFAMLIFTAGFLGIQAIKGKVNDVKQTLIPLGIIVGVSLLLIVVIQKDLGTGLALISIVFATLFAAGINKRYLVSILIIALAAILIFIVAAPHRVSRVLTFLQGDDTSTSDAGSYHIQHAKIAIGTGGFFGVGIGNSVQATGYLPEAINDSVFAILGETFGFIGLMAILAIFVALLMRMLRIMDHLVDIRLKLLAAGCFGWFGAHVILNIGAMIGIFPLTGITLPFLSYGGTSMVLIAGALGLMFQISRYTVHSSTIKEAQYANSHSGRRERRTRYASRRSNS